MIKAPGNDTWTFAKQEDLINLKSDADKLHRTKLQALPTDINSWISPVDKLDVDKLKIVPIALNKLGGVSGNDIVKEKLQCNLESKVECVEAAGLCASTLIYKLINKI